MNTLRTMVLKIHARTVQELFLNSSSRTVLKNFIKNNGPFNVHALFLHCSRTNLAQF